ncbi:YkgJ family cysteine cluster protein [Dysgonomonas sp. 520]|uniref:YkgJ family cysteine cluster protein n=1 Tax=Dysgonomonas sp. 520 TaxID=2302931 RepID=UPI0013D0907A|nr:YkgJ family cysteine cluster protein [Dysgonomonas sp. 520]NDW10003.1 YkgJ family cysteine cluster protein [Dysgonomonas sp. 520]
MKEKKDKYSDLSFLAEKAKPGFNQFLKKNKKRLEKMDHEVHELHEKYSEEIDCLLCANCCRSLGPAIYDKDVERMAKALRIKPSEVMEKYLRIDEDKDYVFKSMPCPFLMPDNYCQIYESRPKACREYPHTDRKRFVQIYNLTVKNTSTCPIAYEVMCELINK